MIRIKYLPDEHVDPRLKKAIKKLSPDTLVWRIGDAGVPAFSTSDPEILAWCENSGFLLVTNNRASMPVNLQEHLAKDQYLSGIFILNPKMTIAETADELALIWGASEAKEYYDQIWYLPLSQ